MNERRTIPIFFACDEDFVKYMMVTLRSVIDNASKEYEYKIYVLNTGISNERQKLVKDMENENFSLSFVDVSLYLDKMKGKLPLRDYYSMTTY
jgi:lipopolysaccharide biosynthesis glycosyltransferase